MRSTLLTLCVTQITSWGVLYYAFPVLLPSITADTGWSAAWVTAAFSTALVISALVGIPVGRILDRHGPRQVMTTGSVLAVLAVGLIATAQNLAWFFLGWALAGIAMAGVLYTPAFAALTRWYGPRRVQALTALTMAAGFTSTIFAPLTAVLVSSFDWRQSYGLLAILLVGITIPGHALGLRRPWPAAETAGTHGVDADWDDPTRIARSGPFLAVMLALSLGAFAVFAALVNLVPLLVGRGLSTGLAAIALGLGGVGQVLGRLGYGLLTRHTTARTRTAAILIAVAATTIALGLVPGPAGLLVALAMLGGAARGTFTLLQATAVSDRWGTQHYGRLNGLLSAPVTLSSALAPWAGAVMAGWLGGYPTVFVVLAGTATAAAIIAWLATEIRVGTRVESGVLPDAEAAVRTDAGAVRSTYQQRNEQQDGQDPRLA